jgi:hypothetical protein
MLKHSGSFNGKDFKVMAQIGPLIFPRIIKEFAITWMSLSLLTKLLYHRNSTIPMDIYSGYIKDTIKIFQNQLEKNFTHEELRKKVKLHLLVHIADN